MSTWRVLEGVVVKGYQVASGLVPGKYPGGTIALQVPVFKARGLDLSHCVRGTLNVSISPSTFAMCIPPMFRDVVWHPTYRPENFFFSPCRISFRGATYEGWVYYPDPRTKESHVQSPSHFELLAPRIEGISYGDKVMIEINADEIEILSSSTEAVP